MRFQLELIGLTAIDIRVVSQKMRALCRLHMLALFLHRNFGVIVLSQAYFSSPIYLSAAGQILCLLAKV